MALTSQQDIPDKPKTSEPWTIRRLFPFQNAVSALTKTFSSPFDALLGFLVLTLGIAELLGKRVSWTFYGFAVLILIANMFERWVSISSDIKTIKNEKK